ncbi:hypothetical protein ACFQ2Y_39020 [Streptomyces malaysiensis subsp. malaysiensis]
MAQGHPQTGLHRSAHHRREDGPGDLEGPQRGLQTTAGAPQNAAGRQRAVVELDPVQLHSAHARAEEAGQVAHASEVEVALVDQYL